MLEYFIGPTAHETAIARIREIDREIDDLRMERIFCAKRAAKYVDSTMLESERLATRAEPFQKVALSPCQPE